MVGSTATAPRTGNRQRSARHSGTVVLTPDMASAERLEQGLRFHLGGADLRCTSCRSRDPPTTSPHQDIVSERPDALARLPGLGRGVVIVPAPTAMRLPPRYLDAYSLRPTPASA